MLKVNNFFQYCRDLLSYSGTASIKDRKGMKISETMAFLVMIPLIITLFTFVVYEEAFASDSSGWKICKNDKHKYAIQSPPDLDFALPYGEDIVQIIGDSRLYLIAVEELSGSVVINGTPKPVESLMPKEIISMALSQRCKSADLGTVIWKPIKIGEMDGLDAVQSSDPCLTTYLPWIVVIKNNLIYHLKFVKGSIDEFNNIVSTFKFIQN